MSAFIIVPTSNRAGLTSVSLGVLRAFEQSNIKPLFFKPIEQSYVTQLEQQIDPAVHFAQELFHMPTVAPLALNEVEMLISQGKDDDMIELVVQRMSELRLQQAHDVVVIEGLAPDSDRPFLADKNLALARALQAEIILVVSALDVTAEQVAEQVSLYVHDYDDDHVRIAGFVLNSINVPETEFAPFVEEVSKRIAANRAPLACLGAIQYAAEKSMFRMKDLARYLNARVLHGSEYLDGSRVKELVVAGRSATHMVERFKAGAVIIASGDREDVMMATALRVISGTPLAGLILTCNEVPSPNLQALIAPALKADVPVLLTEHDTFNTANILSHMPNGVPADDLCRMGNMVDYVAENLQINALIQNLDQPKDVRLSPPAFRYRMMQLARTANKRIVLPEGTEPRTVQAAIICQQKGIARCVLLAKPEEVKDVAEKLNVALPLDLEILDPDLLRQKYVEPMVKLRKHKGLTPELALRQLEDTVVLGTMMLAQNDVDGLVSGAIHTTANTIRPALQLIKTKPDASLVSSVFFMLMPDQVLVYGDCAVNPEPSASELADIAIQSANSAQAFGVEPKVAMISYSTGTSGMGAEVEKVKEATDLAKQKRPDLLIDGPLQYDAASVLSVGRQKAPDSPVAGQATVFVFPDLNTGNTTYKAVQRSANVLSVGPMLQGLNKPVNDLSRGALVDDIVYTIALTAIQATQ
ncbi:MAG TPA: phosphate acetyltransferase [Vitreoscilla sp.]|nr:phosphate acetyltransferase [Vitreoscilla sp.]